MKRILLDKRFYIGFLTGVFLTLIFSLIVELHNIEVILDFEWLEKSLDLQDFHKAELDNPLKEPLNLITQVYPGIVFDNEYYGNVYLGRDNRIEAFYFMIHEFYLGFAKVEYAENGRVNRINFYSAFDINLKKYLEPTHSVMFFYDVNSLQLVYDEYWGNLFLLTDKGLVKKE